MHNNVSKKKVPRIEQNLHSINAVLKSKDLPFLEQVHKHSDCACHLTVIKTLYMLVML